MSIASYGGCNLVMYAVFLEINCLNFIDLKIISTCFFRFLLPLKGFLKFFFIDPTDLHRYEWNGRFGLQAQYCLEHLGKGGHVLRNTTDRLDSFVSDDLRLRHSPQHFEKQQTQVFAGFSGT